MKYPTNKLGKHIDVLSGFAFKNKDFVDSGIPVIKIKNVKPPEVTLEDLSYVSQEIAENAKKFELKYDDVLIAMTGSHINQINSVVGRVARVKYQCRTLLNQRVGKIIVLDNNDCDLDFVYYFLSQYEVQVELAAKAGGAANQANISPTDIKNLQIPFPNIEVQRRIAKMLRTYDDLIENNKKQIKLLEEAAQRLYKEWFVDLHFPGYENTEIVDGVPEGWKKVRLSLLFEIIRGKSYSSSELAENKGVLMVNLSNIRSFGGYNRTQEKHFIGKYKNEQEVTTHDLIMGVTDMTQERRTVGRVALVPNLHKKAMISMDIIKLVPTNGSTIFYYHMLQDGGYSELISRFSNGTNVLHLRPEVLSLVDVILPTSDLQNKFTDIAINIQNKINVLQDQIELATESRDRLLPKLMSGEIEV